MTIKEYLNSLTDIHELYKEIHRLESISEIVGPTKILEKEMHRDVLESALSGLGRPAQIRTRLSLDNNKFIIESCVFIKETSLFGQRYAVILKDGEIIKAPLNQIVEK